MWRLFHVVLSFICSSLEMLYYLSLLFHCYEVVGFDATFLLVLLVISLEQSQSLSSAIANHFS